MRQVTAAGANGDRRFALQAVSVLATKIVMLASGLLASVVLARALGPGALGVYTAVFALITVVLTLADLGIRQAVTYLMGGRRAPDATVVSNLLAFLVLGSVLATTLAAGILWMGPARAYGAGVLLPALASVPLLLAITYVKGVALAKGWIRRLNLVDLWQRAAFLILLTVFVLAAGMGVAGATLAYFVGAAVGAAFSWSWLRRVAPLRIAIDKDVARRLLGLGLTYAVVLFALNLNYRVDVLLIERLLSAEAVGLYAVGVRFAELVWQLPAAVGVVLFSASARAETGRAAVARTARVLRTTLPLVVIVCIGITAVAPWLLPALFGPVFTASVTATRLLMPGVVSAVVFKVLYADVAGRGRPTDGLWVFAPLAAANVVLNLMWIPTYGIEGAAVATTVTYLVGAVAFGWRYACREGIGARELLVARRSDLAVLLRRGAPLRRRRAGRPESGRLDA